MLITKTSPITGKKVTLDLPITHRQLDRWEAGELIQNVFPDLTANEREFLMTGCSGDDWGELTCNSEDPSLLHLVDLDDQVW